MDKTSLQTEGIIKEEKIGYLKSKFSMRPGTLVLTPKRIVMESQPPTFYSGGLLGILIQKMLQKKSVTADIPLSNIQTLTQGKHGLAKNILEITDKQNNQYRILVKNYGDWENAIKKNM